MAWLVRNDRRYFYRSVRVGGRVTRQYLGSGPEAEEAAAAIERRRADRAAQAELLRQEEETHAAAIAPLEELCDATDGLVRAALTNQGYHQHDRGEWRRRRYAKTIDTTRQDLPGRTA